MADRDRSRRITIVLFLLVPVTLLLLFTYLPLVMIFFNSFFSKSYTQMNGFIGWENYREIFSREEFFRAMPVSLYYMAAAVVQVVSALALAVLLHRTLLRDVYKSIYVLPYMINGISIGYIFRLFYTRGYVLDSVLQWLGASADTLPFWLRDQAINNWSLAFSSVWRYTGFSLILFIGAIGAIDRSQFEEAELDGADRLIQFRYIIWPEIRRIVLLEVLLSVVSSLSEFELPYAIAFGGANGTATYMTLIYRIAFSERKIGLASAMTVILMVQIILLSLIILSVSRFHREERGRPE